MIWSDAYLLAASFKEQRLILTFEDYQENVVQLLFEGVLRYEVNFDLIHNSNDLTIVGVECKEEHHSKVLSFTVVVSGGAVATIQCKAILADF